MKKFTDRLGLFDFLKCSFIKWTENS